MDSLSKESNNHTNTRIIMGVGLIIFGAITAAFLVGFIVTNKNVLRIFVNAVKPGYNPSQQQGTLEFAPPPAKAPVAAPGVPPATHLTTPDTAPPPIGGGPLIGGPVAQDSPYYCIDDHDPDGCDDSSSFLVAKGTGGVAGTCGTVIEMAHKIVRSLPWDTKATRDRLTPSVTSTCYPAGTGTYSGGYISTFFVIDAYNLAGYHELTKSNASQVSGTGMLSWWRTPPTGYTFNAYTGGQAQMQSIVGKTIFINVPSGVHVGVVNAVDIFNTSGDGVLSILQSGTRFYIDRFIISGWQVQDTPQHQTVISGIAGFGGH